MSPKFGTSGLRGLVTELTDHLCAGYVRAFLRDIDTNGTVLIGRDLRSSSPRITKAVAGAIKSMGLQALDCGVLPTPALAMASQAHGTAAIMVTGSHIPDDRNGLKFYRRDGEISKEDESRILAGFEPYDVDPAEPEHMDGTIDAFLDRYLSYFGTLALSGLRIGVYEHSSAARDLLGPLLSGLGASTVSLGRSEHFIPVDTEAIDSATRKLLSDWATEHDLDIIVSTDGDADRPMVADAEGHVVPGDILGPLTARCVGADTVVTPVSSNTSVDLMAEFNVVRTRIGSPYVIAGMNDAGGNVVGYEANGGFLVGFEAKGENGTLPPLMTRDCILPIVAPLVLAKAASLSLSGLVDTLPSRFTAADRLVGVPSDKARRLLESIGSDSDLAATVFGRSDPPSRIDRTDGYRATFSDGLIQHLRPSGNAPEFRIYVESDDAKHAQQLLYAAMKRIEDVVN